MSALAIVVAAVVTGVTSLVTLSPGPVAAQTPADVAVDLTSTPDVLLGDAIDYSIVVSNNGTVPRYNLTIRDVLPLGTTYTPGSTLPTEAGEPLVVTNQVENRAGSGEFTDRQTLIWTNVADVTAADSFTLTFDAEPNTVADPAEPALPVYAVGSTISNSVEAYTSTDPRRVARFDSTGVPTAATGIDVGTDTVDTGFSAIKLLKTEDSPDAEIMRGLHDGASTVYSLRVQVTDAADVDAVTLRDYLGADLEFLGCGGIDNTAPGVEEYAGSSRLDTVPAATGCTFPDSVETIQDPPPDGARSRQACT